MILYLTPIGAEKYYYEMEDTELHQNMPTLFDGP